MKGFKPWRARARLSLLVVLFMALGVLILNAPPRAIASSESVPAERVLNHDGTINLQSGLSGSLDLRGWTVTIDRKRGPILTRVGGGTDRSQIDTPNSPQSPIWTRLFHTSVTGGVNAIALMGGDIYIGGNFVFTADDGVTAVHQIAKYSGGVWSALAHTGLNASVNALAVVGTDLYVGGYFDNTWDLAVSLASIARYDTVGGAWVALSDNGILSGPVLALATIGNNLYVGGAISGYSPGSGVADMNGIAVYNTAGGTWSALPHRGLQGQVQALAVSGSDLYVGGGFSGNADLAGPGLNNIARYSGGTWSALAHNGLNQIVQSLAISGTELYVGGQFTQTFDSGVSNLNLIARYDTSGGTWSALAHNGLKGTGVPGVRSLAVLGGDLYVGGRFSASFDNAVLNLNNIARYDTNGGAWSTLPNQGLSSDVLALRVKGSDLYAGGDFGGTFDATYTGQFVKLGSGFSVYLPLILR
ncbi:MAG TPA: hypothetical protein VMP08_09995 [Anaerolineae bacterium]|nr:hypothetical protein [Anaerolineae bacterium]